MRVVLQDSTWGCVESDGCHFARPKVPSDSARPLLSPFDGATLRGIARGARPVMAAVDGAPR